MELMPPVGWADVATRRDLDALEQRLDLRFGAVDLRFEAMDHQVETLRHELVATVRGELLTTVTVQTRMLMLGNLGAVLSTAALALHQRTLRWTGAAEDQPADLAPRRPTQAHRANAGNTAALSLRPVPY